MGFFGGSLLAGALELAGEIACGVLGNLGWRRPRLVYSSNIKKVMVAQIGNCTRATCCN